MAARHRQAKKLVRQESHKPINCGECGNAARTVPASKVYPHRPDLAHKFLWLCDCGAYVGCHKGTLTPLGSPCGPATREARMAAHAAFDPLWRAKMRRDRVSQKDARGAGYTWLAEQLGIDRADCHIGMMGREMALRVVALCQPVSA